MIMEIEHNLRFDTPEERWDAVYRREPAAEGKFIYAVETTGVYCRPTCASRLPNRDNIRFFDTSQAAADAGFRPCKRCRPDLPAQPAPNADLIIKACRLISEAEQCPTLSELADAVGLSPFYFQRLFRKTVGVTPRQFFAEKRSARLRAELSQRDTVTEAVYRAGYGSSAQFYTQAGEILGMKPGAYKNGGAGARIRYTVQPNFLGWVLIAATEIGVCAIDFGDDRQGLEAAFKARFPTAESTVQDPQFSAWVQETLDYLEQPAKGLDLPLDIQGTAFQRRVWMALREIPSGATASYAQVAERIGRPGAARAVAQACAANHLAAAVPCHRVVRKNGDLGGYRWGIERKQMLLEREARK